MAENRGRGIAAGLLVGGIGGTTLAAIIAALLAAKPAEAAPLDEKIDYLIEALTILVPVLAEVAGSQTQLVETFQQWLAAQGIEPGVSAPWVAKDPEQIFTQAITTAEVLLAGISVPDYLLMTGTPTSESE